MRTRARELLGATLRGQDALTLLTVLLRASPAGPVVLAGVLLVKVVTLGFALLVRNGGVAAAGGGINPAETALWATIVVVAAALLTVGSRRMDRVPRRWLKPSVC